MLFEGLAPVDAFYSGGSGDVGFRITRDGRTDFSRPTREAEAELFQVLLPREASQRLLAQAGKRLHLSRGYLPVTVINFVAERPA